MSRESEFEAHYFDEVVRACEMNLLLIRGAIDGAVEILAAEFPGHRASLFVRGEELWAMAVAGLMHINPAATKQALTKIATTF